MTTQRGWDDTLAAVTLALGGDRTGGLEALTECWAATDPSDHAQRCVLAHYLADLQDSLEDEIAWDEAALRSFAGVLDADLAPLGIPSAAGLAPSLHLNLGDGYARRGDLDAARAQLDAGLSAAGVLPDDGYGAMVRGGLDRLRERLDAAEKGRQG